MQRGTVIAYVGDRGFGFIKPDDGGADVFFHVRALAPDSVAEAGAIVNFDVELDPRSGKVRARTVVVIGFADQLPEKRRRSASPAGVTR